MLTFLDPPKENAGKAITALRDNGVAVKVLTGDNPVVTARICLEVGIDAHDILTGAQIEAMTDNELEREVKARGVRQTDAALEITHSENIAEKRPYRWLPR